MYYAIQNGVEKRIESWEIIIPLKDNEANQFPEKTVNDIKASIIEEFSGFTSFNVLGSWQSGKQIYKDENIIILVDVPVKDSRVATAFFLSFKQKLMKELSQEKIYVTKKGENSEILSVNEFLQELGFEISSENPLSLSQDNIDKLVSQPEILKKRFSYRTLHLERNIKTKTISWEREIIGIKIKTEIKDIFPEEAFILPADKIENCFAPEFAGKLLIVIGDYEYQSYILDKEKMAYIIGSPTDFANFNVEGKEPSYYHPWHGSLTTAEFILSYVGQLLVHYIILRESRTSKEKIEINVGADGSLQKCGGKLLHCPAVIPSNEIQEIILKSLKDAISMYENGTIDDVALMQAKALNRYNEKKGMLKAKHK
jgi:hypothetical protein